MFVPSIFTGSNVGMIEVVSDSKTTAEIQKESGGALGALKEEVLWAHLKSNNPRSDQQASVSFLSFILSHFILQFYSFTSHLSGKRHLHCFLCSLLCYFLCYGHWRPS